VSGGDQFEDWGEGIKCLRLPMPAFGGVNALLIGQMGNHAIVDTGLPNAATTEVWAQIDDIWVSGAQKIACTHMHIDHIGQAGPLLARSGADFLMNAVEHADAVRLTSMTPAQRLVELQGLWARNGFDASLALLPSDYSVMAPFPKSFQSLGHGDAVELGGIGFEVHIGGGHSLAPACFYSPERKILIAGDQLLSGSGPQIVVQSDDPDHDAMGAYLDFLERMQAFPEETLVLPGHGQPLPLGATITRIRQGHLARLERVRAVVTDWMSCAEMVQLVFSERALASLRHRMPHMMPALANYLALRGHLARRVSDEGVVLYGPVQGH
jgi:glyoxylase-like metal-dependent hydrolase (beta-lactamase superfamily II)